MVVQGLVNYYNNILISGDVITADLPMVKNPIYVLCAAVLYLIIVVVGPKFMEKRNALQLRGVLIGYNFLSVMLSIWMMYEFFVCSFLNPDFNLFCQDIIETDRSPLTMRLVQAHYVYFFSKLLEFFDTFFFIARKKDKQISFLHCYHHVSMLLLQWSLVKYAPGAVSYFGPLCNCFIHTLMYTYYMLAAFGPHMQKYLWWKKYLTRMQMYQFVFIFLYCSNAMTYKSDADGKQSMKNAFLWVHWFYMISLFWLFNHFYQHAYNAKRKTEKGDSKLEKLKSS